MIYEYAIEPELAVDWGKDRSEYRYFIEQFGIGTSRMMSEFPRFKNWRKQFEQAAATADPDNELPRITAVFNLLSEQRIKRIGYEYDGNIPWLDNSEVENERQEFQAILARTNPRNHMKVLAKGVAESSPLWKVDDQEICPRKAKSMSEFITPLLANCSELHFIDPHFGAENPRFRKPLEAFINTFATNRSGRPTIKKIVLHTSDKADFSYFKSECISQLQPRIPAEIQLVLQRWKQREGGEKLHHRYILTDIGGVKFDPGLDEGAPGENVELILLRRRLYEKYWKDYVLEPAFDMAEEPFGIVGTKGI